MTESDDAIMLRVAKEEIKRQAAEIERLKARLEVSPDHPYDGIYCRDATIKLQDERLKELQWLDVGFDGGALSGAGMVMPTPREYGLRIYKRFSDQVKALNAEVESLTPDAARYRYIRTHRIGVKWCELYAGGPALDEAIDATMAAGERAYR